MVLVIYQCHSASLYLAHLYKHIYWVYIRATLNLTLRDSPESIHAAVIERGGHGAERKTCQGKLKNVLKEQWKGAYGKVTGKMSKHHVMARHQVKSLCRQFMQIYIPLFFLYALGKIWIWKLKVAVSVCNPSRLFPRSRQFFCRLVFSSQLPSTALCRLSHSYPISHSPAPTPPPPIHLLSVVFSFFSLSLSLSSTCLLKRNTEGSQVREGGVL